MLTTAALLLISLLLGSQVEEGRDFSLKAGRVGQLELGATVDEAYERFGRENCRSVDLNLEGHFSPALEVYLDGHSGPSLVAEIDKEQQWIIWRIRVYDRRFRTDRGLGIDSTLGEIRKNYPIEWTASAEGKIFVRVKNLGMSFELAPQDVPTEWFLTQQGELISDSTRIISVLVTR